MATPQIRAEAARVLREEARALLNDTGLFGLLQARFADPAVTGSASYDLMVWRELDIDVGIEAERVLDWIGFGGELVTHFQSIGIPLPAMTYLNSYYEAPSRGSGFAWRLEFEFAGQPWRVEIWGWDPFEHAVRQARDFAFRTALAGADRDLILRLKTEAQGSAHYYGTIVTAWDIYTFAIETTGDSLSALEKWKKQG